MRLLFHPMCDCKGPQALPRPSFHITERPDMNADRPEVKLSVDLICPICDTPWESYAGLRAPLKKPKLILPS